MYRWVEENGKVHVSDLVPERYKKTAKRIDSTQFEVSAADRMAAQDRAAADRKAAEDRAAADRAREKASATAMAPPSQPAAKPKPFGESECEAAHRQYKESMACFAPFVADNGIMKAEAFEKCTSVPDPSPRCGPVKSDFERR